MVELMDETKASMIKGGHDGCEGGCWLRQCNGGNLGETVGFEDGSTVGMLRGDTVG